MVCTYVHMYVHTHIHSMFSDINDFTSAFDGLVMWFQLAVYFDLI